MFSTLNQQPHRDGPPGKAEFPEGEEVSSRQVGARQDGPSGWPRPPASRQSCPPLPRGGTRVMTSGGRVVHLSDVSSSTAMPKPSHRGPSSVGLGPADHPFHTAAHKPSAGPPDGGESRMLRRRASCYLGCILAILVTLLVVLGLLVTGQLDRPSLRVQSVLKPDVISPMAIKRDDGNTTQAGSCNIRESGNSHPSGTQTIIWQTLASVLYFEPDTRDVTYALSYDSQKMQQDDSGSITALVPCSTGGYTITHNWCTFFACPRNFRDKAITRRRLSMRRDLVTTTCNGGGTHEVSLNGKRIFTDDTEGHSTHTLRLPHGRSRLAWKCGQHVEKRDLYTSKLAACADAKSVIACLNPHLLPLTLAAVVTGVVGALDCLAGWNILATIATVLYLPYLAYRTRSKDEADYKRTMEYQHARDSLCPVCGEVALLLSEHITEAHPGHETRRGMLRISWLRLYYTKMSRRLRGVSVAITAAILLVLASKIDTVGAFALDSLLPVVSEPCNPVAIGAAASIATTIENLTCTAEGCVGDTQLDMSLRLVTGYAASYKTEESVTFDVVLTSVNVVYKMEPQYRTGRTEQRISGNFKCTASCDECSASIATGLVHITHPGSGNIGCGCASINDGCTCAECTPTLMDDIFLVSRLDYLATRVVMQFQSGGSCASFSFDTTGLPNEVLFIQQSKGERRTDEMVARQGDNVFTGPINRLGEFGAFGDLKFPEKAAIECDRDVDYSLVCHISQNYLQVRSCCRESHALKKTLTHMASVPAAELEFKDAADDGVARLILVVPNTPLARNPSNVILKGGVDNVEGCFACAAGARVSLTLEASGPGFFDVRTQGGKVDPVTLVAVKGPKTYVFLVFLGVAKGSSALIVGQQAFPFEYELKGPDNNVVGVPEGGSSDPGPCVGFFSCWSFGWHIPKWATYVLLTVFSVLGLGLLYGLVVGSIRVAKEVKGLSQHEKSRSSQMLLKED